MEQNRVNILLIIPKKRLSFILENGDMAMEYDLVSQIIGISRKYDPAPFAQPSFYIIVRVGGL